MSEVCAPPRRLSFLDLYLTLWIVNDLGVPWGPVAFSQNAPSSNLTYDPGADLTFSTDGGATFPLTVADLVPDATGCDPRITHLRINPTGDFAGATGAGVPGFTLQFRVQVR